ncbi:hypothetical protein [Pseudonocardia sp. WMMC193]|uniref:hypothetical protein n=1 Tax=Pseudonocardia sp. WMMC193 TaxID=2911965 RepID=UPI001F407A12|nr:hypothetical protein [Pseudonocardia sp. WMMC193]MCF7550972.1 hypothetical protein [Pseudonocardia sp. WMMC193]
MATQDSTQETEQASTPRKVKIVYTFHPEVAKQGTEDEVSPEWARSLVRHGRARYADAAARDAATGETGGPGEEQAPSGEGDTPPPLVEETSGKTRRRATGGPSGASSGGSGGEPTTDR